ncbi:Na+/H+ antiporter NhaA [Paraclostridium sordellii]|uniref:Na+/H+ antiporter NhaA n=1 Tax=Paraclostridium sordellii TaxID=1505 RepID=UPI0009BF369F|nr:Na+/H+ antiporter NhaA [Paeniclostridium sordellii]MBW4863322.1 Na+/H+ antiporter NhaA [Paeniclostridium sp.]MBW4874135.1 Na+/H+ antiporter NhaA [Paeniclostridium sp.]MBX9179571.1 Na+/H+ antiporter NhaA [Paeniclostridium sordellii]
MPRLLPGTLLFLATIFALIIANSPFKNLYHYLFDEIILFDHFNLHMIINDFFMAIFFLVVGCEIKREILYGHLSDFKKAAFPILAACGGVIFPAIIFFTFNLSTPYSSGVGIPISTDIAFAVGVFMIFKNKLNTSLKVFLLSLAVVDDLLSILMIAILYSSNFNYYALGAALLIVSFIALLNKLNKNNCLLPYLVGGFFLWSALYLSGIHATISGVILAMIIPMKSNSHNKTIMASDKVEHYFTPVCNLIILPLFAFSNTGIDLNISFDIANASNLISGIVLGLVIGKPLGIMIFTYLATKLHIAEKPKGTRWSSIFLVSLIAGIGFTMSIFVTEIAFEGNLQVINLAKASILLASIISCTLAYACIEIMPSLTGFYSKLTSKNFILNK